KFFPLTAHRWNFLALMTTIWNLVLPWALTFPVTRALPPTSLNKCTVSLALKRKGHTKRYLELKANQLPPFQEDERETLRVRRKSLRRASYWTGHRRRHPPLV